MFLFNNIQQWWRNLFCGGRRNIASNIGTFPCNAGSRPFISGFRIWKIYISKISTIPFWLLEFRNILENIFLFHGISFRTQLFGNALCNPFDHRNGNCISDCSISKSIGIIIINIVFAWKRPIIREALQSFVFQRCHSANAIITYNICAAPVGSGMSTRSGSQTISNFWNFGVFIWLWGLCHKIFSGIASGMRSYWIEHNMSGPS